jgi:putative DNA primase/helicase
MNDYRIQRAVMLIGSGRNGKSVYLHVLKSFIGAENVSSQSIQNLSDDKFATFNLFGKIANIYSDLSSSEIKDTSTFKTLTSGMDSIRAEQKFKDQFSFVNRAKLLFSCNQIPKTSDVSDAFFRRWVIIIFPFKFEGKEENKNLVNELVTMDELSGLFNVAVEKYKALQLHEDFTTNQSVDDVREMYTRLSDPIGSFILDKLSVMSDSYLPKEDVYAAFIDYCRMHKFPTMSEKMFGSLMFSKLPVTHFRATYTRSDGSTAREMCWKGISWKSLDEEDIIKEFRTDHDSRNEIFMGDKE